MELARSRNRSLPVHLGDQLLEFHEATLKIASLSPSQRLRVLRWTCRRALHEHGTGNTTHAVCTRRGSCPLRTWPVVRPLAIDMISFDTLVRISEELRAFGACLLM
jgi:hypothetical protein